MPTIIKLNRKGKRRNTEGPVLLVLSVKDTCVSNSRSSDPIYRVPRVE